jgi:hypothetical protein
MEPNILNVEIIENYKIRIHYANDEIRIFDFSSFLDDPFYSKLKDYEFFKTFKILCNTIYWDDDVDISPEDLYEFSVKEE